jgi:simple sugar transport system permease protein
MSGALAGLGGAVLVFGSESHRMVTDGSTLGFTGGAGFNGIVAALLGGLHPLWTIPASFLFGGLIVGGQALQRAVQVPSALIVALNGLVVIFVVAADRYRANLLAEDGRDMVAEADDEGGGEASVASSAVEPAPRGTDSYRHTGTYDTGDDR